ncbi:hypothetical protein [uncultured Shewanella sp.]|nr:hypothetical protein [uncultured Shewanella sp.]
MQEFKIEKKYIIQVRIGLVVLMGCLALSWSLLFFADEVKGGG